MPVSRTLQRKLSALCQLEDIDDFESFVATQIECIVEDRISQFIGATSARRPQRQRPVAAAVGVRRTPSVVQEVASFTSVPSPEAELSHESYFDEEDGEDTSAAPAASVGGLTMEQIENDDHVEDPDHEAVGSPGEYSFEDLAAAAYQKTRAEPPRETDLEDQLQAIGAEKPAELEYVPADLPPNATVKVPRSVVRQPPKVRAKVREMTEIAE